MQHFSISDLAKEFDISTRTIRYYEELGMIQPDRTQGGTRIYTRKDRTRLRLILRGKRFGFSLEEIKEMIELFDQDRTGRKQLEKSIAYGARRIREVNLLIDELTEIRNEMEGLMADFERRLSQLPPSDEQE